MDLRGENGEAAAAAFAVDGGHAVGTHGAGQAEVVVSEEFGDFRLGSGQLRLYAGQFGFEPLLLFFHPFADFVEFFLGLGQILVGDLDGGMQLVDPLHRFQDLVRQHAVGLLVRRDLILEKLVLLVVVGGVELPLQVVQPGFALLELEVLFVGRHFG